MVSGTAPVLGIVVPLFGVAPVLGTEPLEFELEPLPEEGVWPLLFDVDPELDEPLPLLELLFEVLFGVPLEFEPLLVELPPLSEPLLSTLALGVVFLDELNLLYNHFPPIYSPNTSAATNKPVNSILKIPAGRLTVSVDCK